MSRVLIISNDVIAAQMAGPGIRTWELAKLLAMEHTVTLLTPNRTDLKYPKLTIGLSALDSVKTGMATHDVVIGQGQVFSRYPFLKAHSIVKVIDLYDPSPIGFLETSPVGDMAAQMTAHHALVSDYYSYLRAGDMFLCASERQWDLWVGMLTAAGRINPAVYHDDRMLRKLLIVAPFGVPTHPPIHRRRALKGVWPGIDEGDVVVLWGGGLWEWFDPMMAVSAMNLIRRKRSDIKLFFMGVKRPNASVTTCHTAHETIALAKQLDVMNRYVFFNDWAPYEDRENFLLEADLGINVHRSNLETRFSFRTRMMDYFWAGLPVVTTEGDPLSDLVREKHLGLTVPCGDVASLAETILQAADAPEARRSWKKNCFAVAEQFTWDHVFEPVIAWCRSPVQAGDKEHMGLWPSCMEKSPASSASWGYYMRRAGHYYRAAGFRGLINQTIRWWSNRQR